MSFSSIVDALRSSVTTTLAASGDSWHRLAYVYELEKNDSRSNFRGFGVRGLDALEETRINKRLDIIQRFEVILMKDYVNQDNDDKLEDDIKELQDRAEEIYSVLMYTKVGSTIITGFNLELAEPELLTDNNVVVQRFTFDIRYRIQL